MQTVLIIVHLIIVLALIGVVLLQRSEGGGMGLGGGGGGGGVSGFMTGRGQANALTRATAVLAVLFFITSLSLTVLASYGRAPTSILDNVAPAAPGEGPGVLEQLQRLQGDQPGTPAAPGAPAAPAPAPAPGVPQVPQSQ
jgi:preprotein translocase subunit SecG